MNMNRERFVKPKIDKYIQLYSKKAKVEEGIQTIGLQGTIDIENGGLTYPSNQAATISAPATGPQPTVSLSVNGNGTITGATVSNYANSVYTQPPTISLTQTATTSVKSVEIVFAGENYQEPPILSFGLPSTVRTARGTAVITNNVLTGITILDGGLGYTEAPIIKVDAINYDPTNPDYTPAVIVGNLTAGVITSITITSGGDYTGYTADELSVFFSRPVNTAIATATCSINEQGQVVSVNITNGGSGYLSPPEIELYSPEEGETFAIFKSYLYFGYGANLSVNYQYNPTVAYKYSWELDTPIELNENGTLQVVHREFSDTTNTDYKNKILVVRMHDISTKSIVNTKNIGNNADFNGGIVVDVGVLNRLLPNEIVIEINPQVINRITLSLNQDVSGFAGIHTHLDFLVIIKVVEKEPSVIEFGTLNNINFLQ